MIRDKAATACATAILTPFIEAGQVGAEIIPYVATVIANYVRADEAAQAHERKETVLRLAGGSLDPH